MVIPLRAKDQLWCAVVSRHDVGSVHPCEVHIEFLRGTEITNFDSASLKQNIFRLEISVTNTVFVHLCETLKNLSGSVFDLLDSQMLAQLDFIFQRLVAKLHHRVLDQSLRLIMRVEEVLQLDHVRRVFQLV
jgi:hypothetical protein